MLIHRDRGVRIRINVPVRVNAVQILHAIEAIRTPVVKLTLNPNTCPQFTRRSASPHFTHARNTQQHATLFHAHVYARHVEEMHSVTF